ncbi:MAG: hypothetical protein KC731_06405, partial [Myxococcales bacterium]|nr:hypothetical protein [Myxococcales bacterium]
FASSSLRSFPPSIEEVDIEASSRLIGDGNDLAELEAVPLEPGPPVCLCSTGPLESWFAAGGGCSSPSHDDDGLLRALRREETNAKHRPGIVVDEKWGRRMHFRRNHPSPDRSQTILAKTIYRQLQGTGLSGPEIIGVATALLRLITRDLRAAD